MPTILSIGPYRLYFHSHESNEPAHVHIDRDRESAKFWLQPISLGKNLGFSPWNCAGLRESLEITPRHSSGHGMTTSDYNAGAAVKDVRFGNDLLIVDLMDGRTISVPLAWYPKLLQANASQRDNWAIAGAGFGIHWPDLDEDLSTQGLLRGIPAPHGNTATG